MGCMRYLSEAHLRGFERYKVSSFEKGSTAPTPVGGENQCTNRETPIHSSVNCY